jgi:glyoxylase-like metal-dependent hydrolase (beta-lactamase superfamily II)
MGHWKLVDADAGLFDHVKVLGSGWALRTVVLRLKERRLVVVSPTVALGEPAHQELRELGEPAALLAPNHFHHLGLAEWRARYPEARVFATAVAAPRLQKKAGLPAEPAEALPLPRHVRLLEAGGSKAGEAWLRVETRGGTAWVVGDAFFNMAAHPTGLFGLGARLTGTTAGLRIGSTWSPLHLRDKGAYREWLDARITEDRPRILVPLHGDVLVDPTLPDRLRALARDRLW